MESNGGDWRLRRTPAQKGLNGKPSVNDEGATATTGEEDEQKPAVGASSSDHEVISGATVSVEETSAMPDGGDPMSSRSVATEAAEADVETKLQELGLQQGEPESSQGDGVPVELVQDGSNDDDDDNDEGWITPSNLKKHQAKDASVAAPSEAIQETLQAALLTSDFAMQNVALRVNLKYEFLADMCVASLSDIIY